LLSSSKASMVKIRSKMKVLGICGSPRKKGNSDLLLDRTLTGARASGADSEKIYLNEMLFRPCQEEEYYAVNSEGLSVVADDMQKVYKQVHECDVFILASPIFFGSLSAQTKAMIDRFQCVWVSRNLLHKQIFTQKKAGAFISVEASLRQDFFRNARSIVKNFFALINVRYSGELLCPGVERRGDVRKIPGLMERAFELGRDLCSAGE